jgi:thiol-disulfide isomerase/thioredoxin
MKFFNKSFFIGLIAGIGLTIVILFGGGYILFKAFFMEKYIKSNLKPPTFPVSVQANYDWIIHSLDGHEVKLSEFKDKVVFLSFWATWCPPCVAEMPSIQRLYDSIKDQGIVFLCVSKEDGRAIRKFVGKRNFTFPNYTLNGDPPDVFKSRGIPTTFIINRDGTIVFKHIGTAKWDEDSCIQFLKGLLVSTAQSQKYKIEEPKSDVTTAFFQTSVNPARGGTIVTLAFRHQDRCHSIIPLRGTA